MPKNCYEELILTLLAAYLHARLAGKPGAVCILLISGMSSPDTYCITVESQTITYTLLAVCVSIIAHSCYRWCKSYPLLIGIAEGPDD